MGWIACVRCQKFRCEFVARTFALIAPRQFRTEFHAVTKQSKMHPNTTKRTNSWVSRPMGWIRCVHCEKIWCDFVARTSSLIAPVQPILHRVPGNNETLRNAPTHYEMLQNMSLGSNAVDRVRSLPQILMWVRGTNFCINCSNLACSAPSFMLYGNGLKHIQNVRNAP